MYDIIIRGGSLIDGTGAEPVLGDLAIKNGLIAAMGQVDGEAREVIDATGHTVTRFHRHPYSPRCANWLGPRHDAGQLAWSYHGAYRQLRCDFCTLQTGGSRVPRVNDGDR